MKIFFAFVLLISLSTLSFSDPGMLISKEISAAMSKSDDYSKHSDEFDMAGAELVKNGSCSIADLRKYGGFWRSTKNKNGYFMDCKGKRINYTLGVPVTAVSAQGIGELAATKRCRLALENKVNNGKPNWHFFDHSTHLYNNGRVRVTQGFTAKTALGLEVDYRATCLVMQSGAVEIQTLLQK